MIKVFLVDDYELYRTGSRQAFEAAGDIVVVGEADRAHGTAARIIETRPDIALLDIYLMDGSGIDVCREVQAGDSEIRCLMLTLATTDEPLLDSIVAGASGYLQKTVSPSELVEAVRIIASGGTLIGPTLQEKVSSRIRAGGEDRLMRLTDRERDVLQLISEGFTNHEIAERLQLADQTIKNYVSLLLTKMEMSRVQAALYAAERGRHPGSEGF